MKIGFDLDNTIINYDELFAKLALEYGYTRELFKTKKSVKEYILQNNVNEDKWRNLQSLVYSTNISNAKIDSHFFKLIRKLSSNNELTIISHKTETSNFTNEPLREPAQQFLQESGVLEFIKKNKVIFCDSLEEKIDMINKSNIDFYIDDLDIVVTHENLNKETATILFSNWSQIYNLISAFTLNELYSFWQTFQEVPLQFTELSGGNHDSYLLTSKNHSCVLKRYTQRRIESHKREIQFYKFLQDLGDVYNPKLLNTGPNFILLEYFETQESSYESQVFTNHTISLLSHLNSKKESKIHNAKDFHKSIACIKNGILARLDYLKNSIHDEVNEEIKNYLLVDLPTILSNYINSFNVEYTYEDSEFLISHSDIGSQNLLLTNSGPKFIDYEYSGYESIYKIISSLMLHPESLFKGTLEEAIALFDGFKELHITPDIAKIATSLYQADWILIMSNSFCRKEEKNDSIYFDRYEQIKKRLNKLSGELSFE